MFKVGDIVKWTERLGHRLGHTCNPHNNIGIVKKINDKDHVYVHWLKCNNKQCSYKHKCFEYSYHLELALNKDIDNV